MKKPLNVLSLFDGISCGQEALNKKINYYFASEIDSNAIKITQHNFPNTIQLGDVTKINITSLYLSEVYGHIYKKYFNNDIYSLQSIVPEWEMLHRIVEKQTMSAYFGAQIQNENPKISTNTNLSINDRIWFWKNPMGSREGIYNIIRGGERRNSTNSIDVGDLCKHSFWWNGDRQSESRIAKTSIFRPKGKDKTFRKNQIDITRSRNQTIFESTEQGNCKTKRNQTISRPHKETALFGSGFQMESKRNGGEKKENRSNQTRKNVSGVNGKLSPTNDSYGIIKNNKNILSVHKKTQVTLVECEWGIIVFEGKIECCFAGSPCQSFSIAGKQEGFDGKSGLFWEFVRLKNELKPTYFLLENVWMKKEWQSIINTALGVTPLTINSSLLSAQNRKRIYWTNIPSVTVPTDMGILLSDIIPGAVGGYGRRGTPDDLGGYTKSKWTTRKDGKSNCLLCGGSCSEVMFENEYSRPLTIAEWEMLQTLPVGYTAVPGLSITDRKCAIGNSWTLDVIKHIFSSIPY